MNPHPIYDEYYGTPDGKVFSTKFNKVRELKPVLNKCNNGYYLLACYKDGKKYQIYHHRFIADIFLPNPNNLTEINHIDEDKSNNCAENLEWSCRKDNMDHSIAKKYVVEDLKTGEKFIIRNLSDWCRRNSVSWCTAMVHLRGKQKTIKRKRYKLYRFTQN